MARNDTSSRREARVYWIKIKVYYTEAGATASSGGAGNATADARKHQKAVGSVTGSGDANADTRVAKRAESGSGGTGSANANAKASKHANGDSDGAGGASSEAKVSRRAEGSASEGVGNASAVARLVRRWVAYDDLARRSSRAVPVRSGKVFIRPAGTGSYIDIGYCRIESDGPAAVTVKHALNGRRVIGYNDRLEISWLQTSTAEMAALETLQNSEHDLKISRTRGDDEGGGTEERMYEGYYLQLLPKLQRGKFMMILEKQISVAQMGTRMVVT
ncbi:MAG: hypothetical protein MI685_10360 [Chlorobiales bacterium]|nr:hypothetical protein [Chlorobiales bacterium]